MRKLAIGVLLVISAASVHAEELRLGIGTSDGTSFPPYMTLAADHQTYSGLAYDLLRAIVQRTGDTLVPVYLPAPRLFAGLSNGTVDIDIFSNPHWRADFRSDSVFTIPYLLTRTILVYRKDDPRPPRKINDLVGQRVIMVTGFSYSGLDDMVKEGEVIRENTPSNALVLKMIENHHGSLGVSDKTVFFDLVQREGYKNLAAGFEVTPPTPVSMRFPKRLAAAAARFDRAIRSLEKDGTLAKIRARYGLF